MTDPETADATYVGPMTPELVEPILAKVRLWTGRAARRAAGLCGLAPCGREL